jgi:hypothetical protein
MSHLLMACTFRSTFEVILFSISQRDHFALLKPLRDSASFIDCLCGHPMPPD